MEMGKSIGKVDKIRTFWDFTILGVLLPALRGKYIFEKRKMKSLKISSFLSNQITARYIYTQVLISWAAGPPMYSKSHVIQIHRPMGRWGPLGLWGHGAHCAPGAYGAHGPKPAAKSCI